MMDILEAVRYRHAVRSYILQPIAPDLKASLQAEVEECNRESGLHIQLITGEPTAFGGFRAHYGKFSSVQNYFAMAGPRGAELDETIGYYGERLVLKAQTLGLNTCWVGMSYSRRHCGCELEHGEKLVCVIAVGYGTTQGTPHVGKSVDKVSRTDRPIPDWFRLGTEAALLAPTAMNQQHFRLILSGDTVRAESTGGPYSKLDLGIVKYHFELGAGRDSFQWAEK